LIKARIKCENSDVSANGICLLDALMHSSCGEQLRVHTVQKVLARLTKMADCKSKYPAPVQARSDQANDVVSVLSKALLGHVGPR